MKFTTDQAFDELKRQLKQIVGEPAINDRTIKEHIENLMPLVGNDEMELSEFAIKVLPMLKSVDGNYRKHDSDFAKKWEREHPVNKVEPAAAAAEQTPTADDANKLLLERIAKLEQAQAERLKADTILKKRSDLSAKMKEKGIDSAEWIDSILSEVPIDENTDIDAKADAYLKLYNKGKVSKVNPPTPKNPSGRHTDAAEWDDIKKSLERGL